MAHDIKYMQKICLIKLPGEQLIGLLIITRRMHTTPSKKTYFLTVCTVKNKLHLPVSINTPSGNSQARLIPNINRIN